MASLYRDSLDYAAEEIRTKGESARRYWFDVAEWAIADLTPPPRGTGLLGKFADRRLRARYIVKLIAWRRALSNP